jgi:SAM-dependent methyltransferase
MKTDSAQKQEAWSDYFQNRSLLMRFMIWMQIKFLVPHFERAVQSCIKPGERVLDAGCGTAMNTLHICSKLGAKPYGLDISSASLAQAKSVATGLSTNIALAQGDICNMPFTDGSIDLVWNHGVLEHFDNPIEIMSEMARIGKRVFIAVPRKTPLRGLLQRLKGLLGLAADDTFYLYSESQLVDMLSEVEGFKVEGRGSFDCLLLFSWTYAWGRKTGSK